LVFKKLPVPSKLIKILIRLKKKTLKVRNEYVFKEVHRQNKMACNYDDVLLGLVNNI